MEDNTPSEDNTPFIETEVVEYSSVSVWAVLALLLAIVSPLVFISPLLMVVPLASFFLAVVAVLKIRSSDGTRSGMALARWAAVLAIVCMVAAPVRTALRDRLLLQQADQVAQHWLTLLSEDRIEEAIRNMDSKALQKLAGPPGPGESQRLTLPQLAVLLRNDSLTNSLLALGKNSDSKQNPITFVVNSPPYGQSIQIVYKIAAPSGDQGATQPQWVALDLKKKSLSEGQDALWFVTNWTGGLAEPTRQVP